MAVSSGRTKPTAVSLSPYALECLKRIMHERFGPDAHFKMSQTVQQLILDECKRIGQTPEQRGQ